MEFGLHPNSIISNLIKNSTVLMEKSTSYSHVFNRITLWVWQKCFTKMSWTWNSLIGEKSENGEV